MLFRALYEYLLITVCAFVSIAPVEITNTSLYVGCRDLILYQAPTPVFVAPLICPVPDAALSLPEPALIGLMLEGKWMWILQSTIVWPTLLIDHHDHQAHLHVHQEHPVTFAHVHIPTHLALYMLAFVGIWLIVSAWIAYFVLLSPARIFNPSKTLDYLHSTPIQHTEQLSSPATVKSHIATRALIRVKRVPHFKPTAKPEFQDIDTRIFNYLFNIHDHRNNSIIWHRLRTFTLLPSPDRLLAAPYTRIDTDLVLNGPSYILPRTVTHQQYRVDIIVRLYHRTGFELFEGFRMINKDAATLLRWHLTGAGCFEFQRQIRSLEVLFDCWVSLSLRQDVFKLEFCLHSLKPDIKNLISLFTKLTGKAKRSWRGKVHRATSETFKARNRIYQRERKYRKRAEERGSEEAEADEEAEAGEEESDEEEYDEC